MKSAAAFTVPSRIFPSKTAGWVQRVNDRAGRTIVATNGSGTVTHASGGSVIQPGRIVLILDPPRKTGPSTYHVIERLETLP